MSDWTSLDDIVDESDIARDGRFESGWVDRDGPSYVVHGECDDGLTLAFRVSNVVIDGRPVVVSDPGVNLANTGWAVVEDGRGRFGTLYVAKSPT